jgi:hypothetical protein
MQRSGGILTVSLAESSRSHDCVASGAFSAGVLLVGGRKLSDCDNYSCTRVGCCALLRVSAKVGRIVAMSAELVQGAVFFQCRAWPLIRLFKRIPQGCQACWRTGASYSPSPRYSGALIVNCSPRKLGSSALRTLKAKHLLKIKTKVQSEF